MNISIPIFQIEVEAPSPETTLVPYLRRTCILISRNSTWKFAPKLYNWLRR